MSPQKRRS